MNSSNLISLNELILKKQNAEQVQSASVEVLESYLMFTQEDISQAVGLAVNPKTIIVNRMNLFYNEEECVVINFTDISTYQKLKV